MPSTSSVLVGRQCSTRSTPFVTSRNRANLGKCRSSSVGQEGHGVSRRTALELAAALPLLQQQFYSVAAAEVTELEAAAVPEATPAVAPELPPLRWVDVDFELTVPGDYQFIEIPEPPRKDTGPAPPPNPLKVRFDSPNGAAAITVLVKQAQLIKPTFFQVSDITQLGSPQDAAQVLLPQSSVVVAFSTIKVELPPKLNTLGGLVEVPPKTYYRYDFQTPSGVTVAMTAAAQRGRVYVCTGGVPAAQWDAMRSVLQQIVSSFRLKDAVSLF